MKFDVNKWAVLAHNDSTGFGRQASDIKSIVGIDQHLVIPSERLRDESLGDRDRWLRKDMSEVEVAEAIEGLQGFIFFERHHWHPEILRIASSMGIKTVAVPNWEWFYGTDERWTYCSYFACPTLRAVEIVKGYGFKNQAYIRWPVDVQKLPKRKVAGPAKHFIHNAGLVDSQDRKGTLAAMNAFTRIKRKDLKLTVRAQSNFSLPIPEDSRIEIIIGNVKDVGDLYLMGDCCIQPSKMEGIGFMVLEPHLCGIPVISSNAAPMNEFIRERRMLARCWPWKRQGIPNKHGVKHAYLKEPIVASVASIIRFAAETDLGKYSQKALEQRERDYGVESLRRSWLTLLEQIVGDRYE